MVVVVVIAAVVALIVFALAPGPASTCAASSVEVSQFRWIANVTVQSRNALLCLTPGQTFRLAVSLSMPGGYGQVTGFAIGAPFQFDGSSPSTPIFLDQKSTVVSLEIHAPSKAGVYPMVGIVSSI